MIFRIYKSSRKLSNFIYGFFQVLHLFFMHAISQTSHFHHEQTCDLVALYNRPWLLQIFSHMIKPWVVIKNLCYKNYRKTLWITMPFIILNRPLHYFYREYSTTFLCPMVALWKYSGELNWQISKNTLKPPFLGRSGHGVWFSDF